MLVADWLAKLMRMDSFPVSFCSEATERLLPMPAGDDIGSKTQYFATFLLTWLKGKKKSRQSLWIRKWE